MHASTLATRPPIAWATLLVDAVTKPGVISSAYTRFWSYSVGNQLLALFQCLLRHLEPGPINTFMGWQACGRAVKRGEKALTLCMPIRVKARRHAAVPDPHIDSNTNQQAAGSHADPSADEDEPGTVTRFVYKPHWFVLAQTDGAAYVPADLPAWQEVRALATLGIERVPFAHPDGNCQGYAQGRRVAVSPIAFAPWRTLFHELGHVVLGHTAESGLLDDHERTPKSLREVEAESVALICTESLGLGGAEFSRGYIQHWIDGEQIPEKSAQRIFKAADEILKAGYVGEE